MSAISIQLPEEIDACLQVIPASTGRTKSDYFLEAIREHLEDLQDIFIAEQRLADLRAGRTQAISLEQVERNPGLADSVRFQEEKDLSRLDRQTAKRIRGTWMSACPASMTREA